VAKIRNTSGADVEVPSLGRMVLKGQIIDVPDELVEGFTHPSAPSELWEPYDEDAKAVHARLVEAAAPPTEAEPEPSLEDRTKSELEALAEARGLPKSGTKAELIERLTAEEK
jgi:hypothetical protein